MGELPCENICDILSRVPVKSLARFKCVSKQWCNYVMGDSYLDENIHAKRAVKDDPMLIMFQQFPSFLPNSPCTLVFVELKEEEEEEEEEGKGGTLKNHQPIMDFLCMSWSSRTPKNIVLGSCNGLLYSYQAHPYGTTLVVIHPLRKESYELPPIKIWSCTSRFHPKESCGLGFDESTNTFKMVCVVLREHMTRIRDDTNVVKEDLRTMVYVLGTHKWLEISQVPSYPISGEGVFANGCVHWLVSKHDYPSEQARIIICFDVTKEEFRSIAPPKPNLTNLESWNNQLVDLDGQLGFVYNNDISVDKLEVWVLKHTKWVMHCRFDQKPPLPGGYFKVLGFWNKGGDLLITDNARKRLFLFNLKSNNLQEVNIVGLEYGYATDIRMYQTSLFSIRYSIKK